MIETSIEKKRVLIMSNFISFLNSFLSYLLLFGVFVLLAIAAVFIGITLRKRKNAGLSGGQTESDGQEAVEVKEL